ncbi:MAG: hypothetical protein AMJ42_01035 [Deltaproteobacteria bacterium DG_8]|nr:MAG: hypothetical protein AMJ42_01035 [Deltaproteobacteria bacterium DG_8]
MGKLRLPTLALILVLVSQLVPGIDLTHHLETSRVYHEMIAQGRVLLKNPYLLAGQQSTFTYGIPFYTVAGILWYLTGRFTIDFLMFLTSLLSFFVVRRVIKDVGYQTMALVLLWGFVVPDSYIAYSANFFLWLTAYLYLEGKRHYHIPLAIACLTHPFSVAVGLYYAYKEKKNIILIGIFLLYHLIITFVFTSQEGIVLPNIINTLIARVAIGIFPVLLYENLSKKIIRIVSVGLVVLVSISNGVLFLLIEPMQIRGFYEEYQTLFKTFPSISGNMRAVDYDYLPSAYYFHRKGLTINTGSFFESWIPHTRRKWESAKEYQQHLEEHHIDYVLICKRCGTVFPGAHPTEKAILSSHYPTIWKNQYYKLYRIHRVGQVP